MAHFLIDEDLHRSISVVLESLGHSVLDLRDEGLRGSSDQAVFEYAQECKAILLTGDLDFSNTIRFPLGTHKGIVILRFPNEMSNSDINEAVKNSLKDIENDQYDGNLIILSPGKLRIRSKS